MSIAGDAPLPENPTQPPADEQRSFENGFLYGRGDAAERFQPDGTPLRTG